MVYHHGFWGMARSYKACFNIYFLFVHITTFFITITHIIIQRAVKKPAFSYPFSVGVNTTKDESAFISSKKLRRSIGVLNPPVTSLRQAQCQDVTSPFLRGFFPFHSTTIFIQRFGGFFLFLIPLNKGELKGDLSNRG